MFIVNATVIKHTLKRQLYNSALIAFKLLTFKIAPFHSDEGIKKFQLSMLVCHRYDDQSH